MSSNKKESEGIALLSLYGEDEDDDNSDGDTVPPENKDQSEVCANLDEDEFVAINNSNSIRYNYAISVDPLDKFLPPPPNTNCSDELQQKIIKFLLLKKKTGRNFNSEVRNRKEYRNPDFLLHAVTYQDIDQIGSCFSKDVFDPHGYDKSDYYDQMVIIP